MLNVNEFKVIIAGSREFEDYTLLKSQCDYYLQNKLNDPYCTVVIVSGHARGADSLGERYALEKNYKLTKFPANWSLYGKSAGYRRNVDMGNYADALIAFWDGISKGTKHMIDIATNKGLRICVIKYKELN